MNTMTAPRITNRQATVRPPAPTRTTISRVTRDTDGTFYWAVSEEEAGVLTLCRCSTLPGQAAGFRTKSFGKRWLTWLYANEFTFAGVHPDNWRAHALEAFRSIDMDF
ncbi:hypothetical protein ASH00_09055 [Arthrobacter sp. Soil782]|uniref:hypothetical protein n=1 Tax=Arthrobacter sp. Soil782 TaxID=1736410 RepID=UPI0006FADEB3|nr:hypothetical protein [Arthrobacter sp. Soil782]KRF05605.1 hypothetical protein ASH00_09055 [Arthrobacter sp. Soil782]